MKNKSHRYDKNRPRSRYGHKYCIIKLFQYKDAYMNQATPQQHLKHNS